MKRKESIGKKASKGTSPQRTASIKKTKDANSTKAEDNKMKQENDALVTPGNPLVTPGNPLVTPGKKSSMTVGKKS